MRLRSGDTCLADMYTPWSMCGQKNWLC